MQNVSSIEQAASEYIAAGWGLCRVQPGTKRPMDNEWQAWPVAVARAFTQTGIGLIHEHSRTCCLDVDDMSGAEGWLAARGVELGDLLQSDDAVRIESGRPGRAKLLYRLPLGLAALPTRKATGPDGAMLLELRCAGAQDVLPPSVHPVTGKPYEWAGCGDWRDLPELPSIVLQVWEALGPRPARGTSEGNGAATASIAEGGRNQALTSLAGAMRRKGASRDVITVALLAENTAHCCPPLPEHEVKGIAASVARYEPEKHLPTEEWSPSVEEPHPLAAFVRYDLNTVRAPEYLIDGVLVAGNVVIAGARGVGKTTALVPLLALCAHLCRPNHPLRPKLRRRVIYISEDPAQVLRVLYSLRNFGDLIATDAEFNDWFKVVPAARLSIERVVEVASEYVKLAHVNRSAAGAAYLALPVVVFDTRSAIIDIDDENNNAESSRITAVLRQRFAALPTITIAHTPKAIVRGDLAQMTTRGAGAQEADVQQVAYLFADEATKKRYLSIGGAAKKRFESDIDEIEFTAVVHDVLARDELGDQVPLRVIHAEAQAIRSTQRQQDRTDHQSQVKQQENTRKRTALLDAADNAWRHSSPLSKTALLVKAGGHKEDTARIYEELLAEGWLYLIEVPKDLRANNARGAFVVRLQEDERRQYMETGQLPPEKVVIPPCWRKAVVVDASNPARSNTVGTSDHVRG